MDSAIAYVFLSLLVVCFGGMIAGLITPKAGFFLKRKTRLRASGAWLFLGLACFMGLAVFAPDVPQQMADAQKETGIKNDGEPAKNEPRLQAATNPVIEPSPSGRAVESNAADHAASPNEALAKSEVPRKTESAPLSLVALLPGEIETPAHENRAATAIPTAEPPKKVEKQPLPVTKESAERKAPVSKSSFKSTPKEKAVSGAKERTVSTAKTKTVATKTNATGGGGKYSGNLKTFKLHNSRCRYYRCRDCVASFNSRDEALAAGYVPCGVCGG